MPSSDFELLPVFARKGGPIVAYAVVDADVLPQLDGVWTLEPNGYVSRRAGRLLLHRVVLGLTRGDGLEGDHRDGERLDCRRANLRVVTRAQNAQNLRARRGSTSRFRGVAWYAPRRCWQASVQVAGRQIKVGYRHDEFEAALLVEERRREMMPFAEPDPELVRALERRAA